MTTLSQARKIVRQLLDDDHSDPDERRWSDSEVDFALESALEEALVRYAHEGTRFDEQVEKTLYDGMADLSAEQPLWIRSVEYRTGASYVPLPPTDGGAPFHGGSVPGVVRVTYVGKPIFPTFDFYEIVYGGSQVVRLKVFDRYFCVLAAKQLLTKDAEVNPALENLEAQTWASLLRTGVTPKGREMVPLYGFDSDDVYFSGYPFVGAYRWRWDAAAQSVVVGW